MEEPQYRSVNDEPFGLSFTSETDISVELVQARSLLNDQLAPPNNTPQDFRLAWDFWWRVATRHEPARNAHAFTYHGIHRLDGENAEGIRELVQNIPVRIQALEQRVAAGSKVPDQFGT